ncbi:hypothetical protein DSO57_1005724 [Entomophthora muscae]|uniref:Uncharacterized protein n=1 Tax=Entomophthora muscae TaxID=34485 RepID=A0ACC2T7J3_9FUNG|nr:hypothetical protein DSO57_1005724 [Entomophthora muscae]
MRGSATPLDPHSQSLLSKNPCDYHVHNVETLNLFQVYSDNPFLQASHSSNKITPLVYPFCFCGNNQKLLVDTGANHTMIDQGFADSQQLNWVLSQFKAVQVADSCRVAINLKTQQLGEYFSKIRDQVGNLEACEHRHNWIDCHHQSKDFGVHVIASEITGLGGVGQYQRGPGVLIGGVELCQLLVKVLSR